MFDYLTKTSIINFKEFSVSSIDYHGWISSFSIRLPRFVCFFVFFFCCLSFLSRTFTNHKAAGERRGYLFNFSLPLLLASQTLIHSRAITAESLPLHIASSRTQTSERDLVERRHMQ